MEILMDVKVVDENGKLFGLPRNRYYTERIMDARHDLCCIMNDRGGVEAYNNLAALLGLDYNDSAYVDAYQMLSNACWSSILKKSGCDITIIDEVIKRNHTLSTGATHTLYITARFN